LKFDDQFNLRYYYSSFSLGLRFKFDGNRRVVYEKCKIYIQILLATKDPASSKLVLLYLFDGPPALSVLLLLLLI